MDITILDYDMFTKHLDTIQRLMTHSYLNNFSASEEYGDQITEKDIQDINDYLKDGSAILLGAFIEGVLVGFLWSYKHHYHEEVRLHINEIVVEKEFRGRGIAKQLLKKAEHTAKELKVNAIDLMVTEGNTGALNLYERFDFVTERRYMKKNILNES